MRKPTQLQAFHRNRGFLMKGRIAALYANMAALVNSQMLTQDEKESIICAASIVAEIKHKFDVNTRVLKLKRFGDGK
jgi:hypothetical protein